MNKKVKFFVGFAAAALTFGSLMATLGPRHFGHHRGYCHQTEHCGQNYHENNNINNVNNSVAQPATKSDSTVK